MRRIMNSFLVIVLTMTLFIPSMSDAASSRSPMIEIGNASGLEGEVKVPVRLHDLTRLSSGSFKVDNPNSSAFELDRFEKNPKFDGGDFNTTVRIDGNELYVDFISSDNGNNVQVEQATIGYIVYDISENGGKGSQSTLPLIEVSLQDQSGRDQRHDAFDGVIAKKRAMGDVLGINAVNAAQSLRILQHVNGTSLLSGYSIKNAADVDGNGTIAQADAMKILRNVVGLDNSFIQNDFSIEVTDRNGNTTSKEFTINATETEIEDIETLNPVSVEAGETPSLPSEVNVTYKDGSTEYIEVNWDSVNTTEVGTVMATGDVGNTGLTVTVEVMVHDEGEEPFIPSEQIVNIEDNYVGFLNVYTIEVDTKDTVYRMELKGYLQSGNQRGREGTIEMHYEGDNRFSLATPRLQSGQSITLIAYDELNEKIVEHEYQLK